MKNILSSIILHLKGSKEAKNATWLILGRIVQMLLAFIVSIITARYLGPNQFGIINYATAYVAFFTSLCTLGINSVIIKDFVQNPNEQGTAIGSSLAMRLISSALSSVLIVLIVSVIDYGENMTIIVSALCSFSLVFQAFDTLNCWFQSRYESKVTALVTLIAYTVTSLYKIVLFIFKKSVFWFAFATSIDYACLALLLVCAYRWHSGPKWKFSFDKSCFLLRQSYHYILSGMMVAIYGQTDKLMLKQMLGETSVGYYSLATSVNYMWVFVLQALIDSTVPTIMRFFNEGNKENYLRKNRQLYTIVIYVSIVVAAVFFIFGKWAIVFVYGKEYAPAATTLKIICWYTIFSYLGVARNAWIVCENKQKYLKYIYSSAVIINIALNFLLIPKWGASGAAIASLITQIGTSILLPCLIKDLRGNVRLIIDAFLLRGIK